MERYDSDGGGSALESMRSLAADRSVAELGYFSGTGSGSGAHGALVDAWLGYRVEAGHRPDEVVDSAQLLVGMMSGVHARLGGGR